MPSEPLAPIQPSFVLRGHSAQVHAVRFIQGNSRLISADAEGWVVSWNLSFKRPVAVWKAHSNAILGIVLSMATLPSGDCYLTSSADAVIAKHPLPAVQGIWKTELKPYKVTQTKHSGQQGIQVRSDAKIFATAGWDARVRVYSAKTMKEVAVLTWHKVGCYTTAFAEIRNCDIVKTEEDVCVKQEEEDEDHDDQITTRQMLPVATVQQRRDAKAQTTHWLAVGSKDGKISLWDIY
ncbi:MAG: hypothetical protein Q9222_007217 [Ikaeria aurantiellina]